MVKKRTSREEVIFEGEQHFGSFVRQLSSKHRKNYTAIICFLHFNIACAANVFFSYNGIVVTLCKYLSTWFTIRVRDNVIVIISFYLIHHFSFYFICFNYH